MPARCTSVGKTGQHHTALSRWEVSGAPPPPLIQCREIQQHLHDPLV